LPAAEGHSQRCFLYIQDSTILFQVLSIISLFLFYFSRLYHAQFETRVQFDAATRLRSDVPFGPILNLIDARSISIIGARFPFLAKCSRCSQHAFPNVPNTCHGCVCHDYRSKVRWLPILKSKYYITADVFLRFLCTFLLDPSLWPKPTLWLIETSNGYFHIRISMFDRNRAIISIGHLHWSRKIFPSREFFQEPITRRCTLIFFSSSSFSPVDFRLHSYQWDALRSKKNESHFVRSMIVYVTLLRRPTPIEWDLILNLETTW